MQNKIHTPLTFILSSSNKDIRSSGANDYIMGHTIHSVPFTLIVVIYSVFVRLNFCITVIKALNHPNSLKQKELENKQASSPTVFLKCIKSHFLSFIVGYTRDKYTCIHYYKQFHRKTEPMHLYSVDYRLIA